MRRAGVELAALPSADNIVQTCLDVPPVGLKKVTILADGPGSVLVLGAGIQDAGEPVGLSTPCRGRDADVPEQRRDAVEAGPQVQLRLATGGPESGRVRDVLVAPAHDRGDAAAGRAGRPAALGGTTPSGMVVSDAPDESGDVVIRLLRLLDRPRDVRVLAPVIKRRQFGVRPSQDAARLHGITRAEVPAVV
ncbi:AraC family transcriptional regulator N-terminal domain-containing protein [Micromonospora zamorensis]|uniref:AraC family transcriptional regulator N-terminal domain-containing protein n=1 Tax=Micromonospora zamorensis TaxID=709883 RepID=A0ABZ1PRJ1_9ACTN